MATKGSLKNLEYLKDIGDEDEFNIPIPDDFTIPAPSKMESNRYNK